MATMPAENSNRKMVHAERGMSCEVNGCGDVAVSCDLNADDDQEPRFFCAMHVPEVAYRVVEEYSGSFSVYASDDPHQRVASVGRWMPGPMVHVRASDLHSPALAKAIAKAMLWCAAEIEAEDAR